MKQHSTEVSILLLLSSLLRAPIAVGEPAGQFKAYEGLLCIRSEYTQNPPGVTSTRGCAYWCSSNQRCQAFSLADGPCQLFVFDKCSKSVRDCSCSRRGQVFVKQQQGLDPGALCPSGYGDDLCGVKYKLHLDNGNWTMGRQKCESESGLVIMADVTDATEMSHVDMIYSNYSSPGTSFWLGGFQAPGSPEPEGGWYWVACNITLDGSLWGSGDPDNRGTSGENVVGRWYNHTMLSDFFESGSPTDVLCECISPFN